MDMGQGDDRLPCTDRMLTDVAMVPPILKAGLKSASYKTKRSDGTLFGATLEMETLSQCGESTLKHFKPSSMNHGKGSVVGQLIQVSETVLIDEPAGGYMEMVEETRQRTLNCSRKQKCFVRLLRDDDTKRNHEAEGIWKSGLFRDARGTDRPVGEPTMESSSVTALRSRNKNHPEDTHSDSDTL